MFEVIEQDIPLFVDRIFWPSLSTESPLRAFPDIVQLNMLSTAESLLRQIEAMLVCYREIVNLLWKLDSTSVDHWVDLTIQLDILRHELKVSAFRMAWARVDASLLQSIPICSERMIVPLRAIQVLMTQISFRNAFRLIGPEIFAPFYKMLQIIKHVSMLDVQDANYTDI